MSVFLIMVAIGIPLIIILIGSISGHKEEEVLGKAPMLTVSARVVKIDENSYTDEMGEVVNVDYLVTFELLEDGRHQQLKLPLLMDLLKDDVGTLRYKEAGGYSRFYEFQKSASDSKQ